MASELAARLHACQGKPGTCPCRARACAHKSSQCITLPAYFAGLLSCQARFRWAGRVAQFLSVWDVHPAFQELQIDIPSACAAPFLRRQVSTRMRLCSAALRSEPIQLDGPRGTRPSLCLTWQKSLGLLRTCLASWCRVAPAILFSLPEFWA
ncbi:unnamed protein product [Effrenium voratum]|nr:unnamed protein product [Effrenium voratum]